MKLFYKMNSKFVTYVKNHPQMYTLGPKMTTNKTLSPKKRMEF